MIKEPDNRAFSGYEQKQATKLLKEMEVAPGSIPPPPVIDDAQMDGMIQSIRRTNQEVVKLGSFWVKLFKFQYNIEMLATKLEGDDDIITEVLEARGLAARYITDLLRRRQDGELRFLSGYDVFTVLFKEIKLFRGGRSKVDNIAEIHESIKDGNKEVKAFAKEIIKMISPMLDKLQRMAQIDFDAQLRAMHKIINVQKRTKNIS